MTDTSYEENIATRLRNRLDGSVLDQWGAEVIDRLLADAAKRKAAMRGALQWFEDHRIELQKVGDGVIPQWVTDGWASLDWPAAKVVSAKDLKAATAGCEHAVGRKTRWA